MTSPRLTPTQRDLLMMLYGDGWAFHPEWASIIWKKGQPYRHVAEVTGSSLARRGYLRRPTDLDREFGSRGWWVLTQEGVWAAQDIACRRRMLAQ